MKKNYYIFKMNAAFLNAFSLVLLVICFVIFYLIYRNSNPVSLNGSIDFTILFYLPYLILHELLHSLAYVIHGAKFKNITYGAHLEKGVLCCLCKQNINKKNILFSLLYPFFFIGVLTLIIGIIFNIPVLVILSLLNISGCSGDLLMFYHLSKLKDYEFSEFDDPTSFGLYTSNDFSKLKMFGLDYIGKEKELVRNDFRKIQVSKTSIVLIMIFYILFIINLVI